MVREFLKWLIASGYNEIANEPILFYSEIEQKGNYYMTYLCHIQENKKISKTEEKEC